MKRFAISLLLFMLLCIVSTVCNAEQTVETMMSFQGFSGIINTPNANVLREGDMHMMYTDQHESIWRNDILSNRQDNYLFSVGLFNFLEIGGRLTETFGNHRGRDLSASVKVSSGNLTKEYPFCPVVAVGIQDVGGGANQLQNKYLVVSEDLWRLRLSAGYSTGSERMKGAFGGVEFHAHDWITLLGEYDTRDTSAGIRVTTPELWITPIRLTATLKSTLNHSPGTLDVAAGITFPLDFQKRSVGNPQTPLQQKSDAIEISKQVVFVPPVQTLQPTSRSKESESPTSQQTGDVTNTVTPDSLALMGSLRNELEDAGFINVRVGQRLTHELVVEYENTIFNHNELDALGIVAGIITKGVVQNFEVVHIIIKRKGLRVAVVSLPYNTLRGYMNDEVGKVKAVEKIRFSYEMALTDNTYYLENNKGLSFPNTSIILSPGLQTFVGTEVGLFDYVLSFRPEVLSTLWNGGVFQARWDIPFSWSKNFDDGGVLRGARQDARMDRAMLFQGVKLFPGVVANLGAGMVLNHNYGTLNEASWNIQNGSHRFRVVQSWVRDTDIRRTKDVYLGAYRYNYAPLDLSIEAVGGKFWGQDKGFSLELKRFFRDTSVSTYYKNTTTAEGKHWQAAGIQLAFPLTPWKDMKLGPVQVRGAEEWSYSQESTLAVGGQKTNDVVSQSLAINPQPTAALYRSYFNRDRLSASYVTEHFDRLKEAWDRYRMNK